jgi:hypothetical protein
MQRFSSEKHPIAGSATEDQESVMPEPSEGPREIPKENKEIKVMGLEKGTIYLQRPIPGANSSGSSAHAA